MTFKDFIRSFQSLYHTIDPLPGYPEYKKGFYKDICYANYTRLRFWSYFLILLTLSQLYSDLTVTGIYTLRQTEIFLRADIVLAFFTFIIFLLTHFYKPDLPENITVRHQLIVMLYLFFHLNWGATISATESLNTNGLPTFLISVFSAATIFFIRGTYFFIFLATSLGTLYFVVSNLLLDKTRIVTEYYSVIALVVIAWVVSRVMLTTRFYTYIAVKKLEQTNLNLDKTVKERTSELSKSNERLMKEIEERMKYEHDLLVAVKKAKEADRLKTVFLANMSHEIRTPLNGILGFGDLLGRNNIPADRYKKYISIIINSGQQLLKIIDDILDISLIESNQLKIHRVTFPLNEKMNEIYEFYNASRKEMGKENILLSCSKSLPDGQDLIYTDPFRLLQIINNLIKNAFKFTFNGKIEFGYKTNHEEFLFFISDTGIGVDIEKRDIIFERFRQGDESLKRSYGGTGLGLSISRGIVEQLGGKIWLDTSLPAGSKFCFTIPVGSSDAKTSAIHDKNNQV
jgi:signal transduction histidine kinase